MTEIKVGKLNLDSALATMFQTVLLQKASALLSEVRATPRKAQRKDAKKKSEASCVENERKLRIHFMIWGFMVLYEKLTNRYSLMPEKDLKRGAHQ